MLKENQKIIIKWSGRNRKHYESFGYVFTGVGDTIEVPANQLSKGCNATVSVICDYCGKEFNKKYYTYVRDHSDRFGDACKDCARMKYDKVMLDKYGVTNPSLIDEVKEKRKQTFIKNFGVDNPSKAQEVKDKRTNTFQERFGTSSPMKVKAVQEKAKKTCRERYGVDYTTQSYVMKQKTKETCLKRYGVDNASKSPLVKDRIKETWMEKYGVENIMDLPEFREKILSSFVKNNNCPTSKMQEAVSDIVKDIYGKEAVADNVQVGECILDILLSYKGDKIDIEYDGWYWHKNRQEQDKRRNYYLMDQGYKVLRIRSMEELPTKEQIRQGIDYLVKENHHLKIIDLDI